MCHIATNFSEQKCTKRAGEIFAHKQKGTANLDLSGCYDHTAAQPPCLLPGRRWIEFALWGKFKTDVECGQKPDLLGQPLDL